MKGTKFKKTLYDIVCIFTSYIISVLLYFLPDKKKIQFNKRQSALHDF